MGDSSCQLSRAFTCVQIWNVRIRLFNLNFRYMATRRHTRASCNAVLLVWASLRLAPILLYCTVLYYTILYYTTLHYTIICYKIISTWCVISTWYIQRRVLWVCKARQLDHPDHHAKMQQKLYEIIMKCMHIHIFVVCLICKFFSMVDGYNMDESLLVFNLLSGIGGARYHWL